MEKENMKEFIRGIVSLLYKCFGHYSWVGIYLLRDNELRLGPWKGKAPTQHTVIPLGKGICGIAATTCKTEIIDEVRSDDRYLACFPETRSEIVVPIKKEGRVIGEIDIDSEKAFAFQKDDRRFLEALANFLSDILDAS